MILIYTTKITNRLQYVVRTVLSEICGFDYKVTQSSEEFLNFKGAKLNYSNRDLPGTDLRIYSSGFVAQKGVKEFTPSVRLINNIPYLFPQQDNSMVFDVDYDIFAACFYMLSRYEEYLPHVEDRHGRFEADQCLAYQMGFLEMPLVDLYAYELRQLILQTYPFVEARSRKFTFIPTYDIDSAYAYKGKGFARHSLLIIRDLITFRFSELADRAMVIWGSRKDPLDTYDFQLELQEKYKLQPVYFFLSGSFGPKDRNISINSSSFHTLVKKIGDYARTGIHPSYASHHKPKALEKEIETLSSILNRPIENSRQHFLKMKIPQTYQNLLKADIKNDFSMGFASHAGFRAGTCTPFMFYDLSLESETRLKVFPMIIMDGTLKDYMKLKPSEALNKLKSLVDAVKAVDGTFISLWHNDSLTDSGQWEGWQDVYCGLIDYIHSFQQ
jgi:hypothetical protein